MKKIIHINKNIIQQNAKNGTTKPVCRVQIGKEVKYCMEVHIDGPSKLVYSPHKPLKCGAKLWIETEADIVLVDESNDENGNHKESLYKTFDEWKSLGYFIKKGEKSVMRNDKKIPLFHKDQVEEKDIPLYYGNRASYNTNDVGEYEDTYFYDGEDEYDSYFDYAGFGW